MMGNGTLELEAVGLRAIAEADRIIGVGNGPEHVLLAPTGRVVRDDAGLQLRQLVSTASDFHEDRSVLGFKGGVEDLLDAALSVLKRRLDGDGAADAELLDDVSGLEHVASPLVGFGAAFEAFDGQHHRGFGLSGRGVRARLRSVHGHDLCLIRCV